MSLPEMIGMLQAEKCGKLSGDALEMCNANFAEAQTNIRGLMGAFPQLTEDDVASGLRTCIPCMTEKGEAAGMCAVEPFETMPGMTCGHFAAQIFPNMS